MNGCVNVEVMNVAFIDTPGSLSLRYSNHGSHLKRAHDLPATVHVVPAVAGDGALRDSPAPAVIKVDVEGYEWAVLRGLQKILCRQSYRLLCLEVHPQLLPSDVDENRLVTFVRECGFVWVHQNIRASMVNQVAGEKEILLIASRRDRAGICQ